MIEKENLVEIGKFQKTHALKGELNALLDVGEEYVADGNALIVETDGALVPYYSESIRPKGASSYLIKLEGVDSVDEAAELVNHEIWAPKDVVREYEGDVMFEDDLEGFAVIDSEYGEIGELEYIDSSTENELMVVRTPDGGEVFIPLVDSFILDIDEEGHKIHTSIPEGLIDLNKKEE